MIKRKWPKTVAALGFHSSDTPVAPEIRASLSLPRESDKERPGSPPGPRAGRQPSSGGCRPGPPAVRGGVRASTGPRVERVLPKALGQGGGRQPSPPAVRGGIWADVSPLGRLIPPAKPKSGVQTGDVQNASHGHGSGPQPAQAAGPLGMPFASQNCPQLYQGESGGLEPAMKPMAGQAGAPLRFLSPLRGPGGLPGQSLATFF